MTVLQSRQTCSAKRPSAAAAVSPCAVRLPDADDLPFLEVALSGNADALVTGNVRHFPGASA